MSVYVIGHRNPDTDAICSAIGYADFLRRTSRPDAVAAACGACNARTELVLEKAGLAAPAMLTSVRPTARQLCHKEPMYCRESEPFMDVYRRMTLHGLRSLPVVDGENRVTGMLSLFDLMRELLPDADDMSRDRKIFTQQERIRQALGGRFLNDASSHETQEFVIMVAAMSKDKFEERLHAVDRDKLLVVVGDRPSVQKAAIAYGVRLLVLTGGFELRADLLETAKARGVGVVVSPHDTAMTIMLIRGAKQIDRAIQRDFLGFHPGARVEQIAKRVHGNQQSAYPILDDSGKLVGVFSRTDLLEPIRTQLILVDHNELSQAVDGAEEADIIEVIDHHRVGGGLITRDPIRFINDTVGSTSTIVARMFKERAMMPNPGIALCLAAGIIADTLNLTSPTATETDRSLLAWLAGYAPCDLSEFADAYFRAGSVLRESTPQSILNGDCKQYSEGKIVFTVAQVEELGMQHFWERREELQKALNAHVVQNRLNLACLMITDISVHKSFLLAAGDEDIIEALDFPETENDVYELDRIVSRKKQLLPALSQCLSRLRA